MSKSRLHVLERVRAVKEEEVAKLEASLKALDTEMKAKLSAKEKQVSGRPCCTRHADGCDAARSHLPRCHAGILQNFCGSLVHP